MLNKKNIRGSYARDKRLTSFPLDYCKHNDMANPLVLNPLNTLMLRDLVYNHRNWVCPVVGIDKKYITVIAKHYGETAYERETISPIPLTEEIITQLGWQQVIEGDEGFDLKKKSVVNKQYHNPDYTTTLNIIHGETTGLWYILNDEFHMRYVHDLQHVLRHIVTDDIGYDTEKGFYLIDGYIERLFVSSFSRKIKQSKDLSISMFRLSLKKLYTHDQD